MPSTHINIELDPNFNRERLKTGDSQLKVYLVARRVRQKAILNPPFPIKVSINQFQKKEGKWLNNSVPNYRTLNSLLADLKLRIEKHLLENWEKKLSPKEVKQWYESNILQDGRINSNHSITLEKYLTIFLKSKSKAKTKENYRDAINKFLSYVPGIKMEEINNRTMKDFHNFLRDQEGLASLTIFRYFKNVISVYRSWYEETFPEDELGYKRAFKGIKLEKDTLLKKNTLTIAEIKKLKELELEPGSKQDLVRDMFLFMCYTSRYLSELKLLNFEDNVTYAGPNQENPIIKDKREKTGEGFINIIINKHHLEILKKYHPDFTGDFFPNEYFNGPNATNSFNSVLLELGKKIKLPFRLSSRVARYTFRNLFGSVLSPQLMADAMGHKNINTQMIYNASNLNPYDHFKGFPEI